MGINNKKFIIITFILMVLLVLGACSQSESASDSQGQTDATKEEVTSVTVGLPIGVESMNPYAHSATPVYGMWRHVIEPLVMFNYDTKEYYGVLAEDWTVENETDWIFTLRKGVTFHDGSEFTAEDVVHSYTRMMEDPESRQGFFLNVVEDIEAIDAHTVKIKTKAPSASLLKELILLNITSKSHYEAKGQEEADRNPIGTGPYKFKDWLRGERFVVQIYENYWGGVPEADEVIFRVMPEDVARVTALERGEVDIITAPTQDLDRLAQNPNLSVEGVPGLRMMMFVLNPAVEPLDNVKVRQAINHAINVESIVEHVQEGEVDILNGPVADNVFGFDPSWKPYEYNPEKARQLLKEAGYPNGFDLVLTTPSGRYVRDLNVSEAAAAQLKEVGINVKVEVPEWGIFATEMDKGAYGMYLIGRGPVFDSDIVLRQYFRTGVTTRTFYSNPEFDELIDKAESIFDPAAREKALQEAGTVLYEDAPAVFLYTHRDNYAFSNRLDWTPRPDEQVLVGFPNQ